MHATVCDYIADLVQNSIEAGASHIKLKVVSRPELLQVTVTDNGKGMKREEVEKSSDPFFTEAGKHDHRKVGLGLALLHQAVATVNGEFEIESEPGKGTRIYFCFNSKHLDTPPLGDIAGTVTGLMTFSGDFNLEFIRKTAKGQYTISRAELIETLGNLEEITHINLAREFISAQEKDVDSRDAATA